jgi:hypothetical protein
MKGFFRLLRKLLFIFLYLFFVVASIVLAVLLFMKIKELNDINSAYSETATLLNQSEEESQVTIDNLQNSFRELNAEVNRLKIENSGLKNELDRQLKNGYGTIRGEILPLLVGSSSFSQYQLVCAENTSNSNLKYCVTASAFDSSYILVLPSGTYIVSANIVSDGTNLNTSYKGLYTEFVKCVKENGEKGCNKSELSGKVLTIQVDSGKTVSNIDPTDWNSL